MHETEVMRDLAVGWGVPADDIILDRDGLNTHDTVTNTAEMFAPLGATRVLAVSHFYHLPRVKMSYQRHGIAVYTVPAQCSYTLRGLPFFMAREVAALWAYYLQPLGDD
ncbi:MAG: YdcF family protein [Planctomycetaceae bacterium]|nr:MAG: YdcF family protein [Planctomycetaceae bacterium]